MNDSKKRNGRFALLALLAALSSAPVAAAIDLRDYDNDLMRDLDKTIKYFEPDITAQNAEAAKEDAEILLNGFKYTEDYFKKKGAADAVEISRKGLQVVGDAIKNIDQNDFDAAAASAREAPQLCKSCHDIYKPRLAR
ncbi:hypothetical protein V3H18_01565 [Methylocystis sp. 9N]|uniref:Cytochrome c n=1 Tax=Methylocystis borbori TaxID=3118750 RepID=A0ABU7XDI1_9HYPH